PAPGHAAAAAGAAVAGRAVACGPPGAPARRGADRPGRRAGAGARRPRGGARAGGGVRGFARTGAVALTGDEGDVVEVQADLEPGVASSARVGLAGGSLSESRDRVRAAVVNSGGDWPQKKLTVGLSPASVPRAGSGFDLAVACGVLAAAERIDPRS